MFTNFLVGYFRKINSNRNSAVTITISSNVDNVNLFTLAGSPTTPRAFNFIVNSGVLIGSTTTAIASLVTGTFPSGSILTLTNNGTIDGRGGEGSDSGVGGGGGDAISCSFNLTVTNTGNIRAGGGGGGVGGFGGKGGRGAGSQGSAASGQSSSSTTCTPNPGEGGGGSSGISGTTGGDGGSYGSSGGTGTDSYFDASCFGGGSGLQQSGSAGGGPGLAMRKNGTTSSITGGTILGSQV